MKIAYYNKLKFNTRFSIIFQTQFLFNKYFSAIYIKIKIMKEKI